MKISFIKYLLFASIFAFSCGKQKQFLVVKPFVSLDVNGKAWIPDSVQPTGMYTDNLILRDTAFQINIEASKLDTQDGVTFYSEVLTLFLVKKQLGKQSISGGPFSEIFYNYRHPSPSSKVYFFFETYQQYGEFTCEAFIVDTTKLDDNWVEITHQEGNFKKIWGKFNINLKRTAIESGCTEVKYSNNTKISNGEFYLEL